MKHRSTPTICNKIPKENDVRLEMQTHRLSLDERVMNLNLNKKLH
jgi:hypothetical protein